MVYMDDAHDHIHECTHSIAYQSPYSHPSSRGERYLKVHLPVSTIVTLLMAHPVVTKSAIRLVACRPVAGRNYLDVDFNLSCDSEASSLQALRRPRLLG